jgi:hypothetical protein
MTGKLVNGQPPPEEPRGRRFVLLEVCAAGDRLLRSTTFQHILTVKMMLDLPRAHF